MEWSIAMTLRIAASLLATVALAACVEQRPVYDARFDGTIGSPRWFDPSERCHDAPHNTTDDKTSPGRISVSAGGSCSVQQQPALHSGVTLLGYEVVSEPRAGRLVRTSPLRYTYFGPRAPGTDSFVIRMRYSGRSGRVYEPTIRYQVRIVPR
jgi:hypothetical protein